MVNMNAAVDEERKEIEVGEINQEESLDADAMCAKKENFPGNPQTKLNYNSSPVEDGGNITTLNCACRPNSVSHSSFSGYEINNPSSSTNAVSTLASCEGVNILQNDSNCEEGKQNEAICQMKNENGENRLKLRVKPPFKYDEDSSSEDEECCIYTYKGDTNQMADLPSSFFRLDLMSSRPNGNSRNSSPDMDYLEMDFDPGPSNERGSSSGSECGEVNVEEDLLVLDVAPTALLQDSHEPTPEPVVELEVNTPTLLSPLSTPSPVWNTRPQLSPSQPSSSGVVWSPQLSPEAQPSAPSVSSCEMLPSETLQAEAVYIQQQSAASYCFCLQPKTLSSASIDENSNDGDTGAMIWTEEEAKEKQVNQIGTSLCGATAVVNALLALNVPYSVNTVKQFVATRFRNESAAIPEYLMSRCNAGATHVDLIHSLQGVSKDTVYARFFHMYPQRCISLTSWLSHWIKKGAVPILTVNVQRSGSEEVADFWHHQTAYGVSAQGVHLTNPVEVQSEAHLWPQLASPSELLVRRHDVLSRWTPDTVLHTLASPALPQWRHFNVLGQVVNVVREGKASNQSPQHITIPASYSSGVTLAILRTNPACEQLRLVPELPVDPFAAT